MFNQIRSNAIRSAGLVLIDFKKERKKEKLLTIIPQIRMDLNYWHLHDAYGTVRVKQISSRNQNSFQKNKNEKW